MAIKQVTSPTIHWTLPYERGSEGVSIATSSDGGLTWQKDTGNPIIEGPPNDLEVTGFRDPSISSLPILDRLLNRETGEYLYATLSGGIVGKTPSVFLYSLRANDLRDWRSLGAIVDIGLDYMPDQRWCGEGGRNFECCSLFELESEMTLITSTEGGKRRWSLWLQGEMVMRDGMPKLEYRKSGVLDWGCFYAASTSLHPVDGRRLVMGESVFPHCVCQARLNVLSVTSCPSIGWIPEDDLTVEQRAEQGWAGMACLPRELVALKYHGVVKALASSLSAIGSVNCIGNKDGTCTIQTLGIRPAAEVLKLRNNIHARQVHECTLTLSNKSLRFPMKRKTWELEFEADILPSCLVFHIVIQHSSSMSTKPAHKEIGTDMLSYLTDEYTLISFDPQAERISVDRQHSTVLPDVKTALQSGSHTLYQFKNSTTGEIQQEPLRIRLFFDVSVIELYANDRFALTTRVYPASSGPASLSLVAEVEEGMMEGANAVCKLSNVALWER